METTANGYRVVYEGGEGEIVEKKITLYRNRTTDRNRRGSGSFYQ